MALLSVEDVTTRFGGIVALDGVSFDADEGEIVGLIGPNGAGKTTAFNVITRVYTPDEGSVTFDGHDLLRTPPHRVIRLGIARTFQNLALFPTMTTLENVLVGAHARGDRARAAEVIDYLGLGPHAHATVAGLPYGTQKRVETALDLIFSQFNGDLFECSLELALAARVDDELRAAVDPAMRDVTVGIARTAHELFGEDIAGHPEFDRRLQMAFSTMRGLGLLRKLGHPEPEVRRQWEYARAQLVELITYWRDLLVDGPPRDIGREQGAERTYDITEKPQPVAPAAVHDRISDWSGDAEPYGQQPNQYQCNRKPGVFHGTQGSSAMNR